MVNSDVLIKEIMSAHSMYYSLRGTEPSNFDINIDSIDSMGDKQLIQLLKMLNSLIKDELEKY